MELCITQESVRDYAKKLHAALKARSVELKLSDTLESLAVALGHRNLAGLDGALKQEVSRYVDARPLRGQTENQFVVTMSWSEEDEEIMVVYPPGTTLRDLASRDWRKVQDLDDACREIPEGMTLAEAVALENYAVVSCIEKYGLHDGGHESTATKWILEYFTFRVPTEGIEVSLSENGDGATKDHILIWVCDEDRERLQSLFV